MNYSYVTYLANDDYLIGTLALYHSLLQTNSKYPLTVMISKEVTNNSKHQLEKVGIRTILISTILPSNRELLKNNKAGYSQWNRTFSKLYIFNLVEFDKIVFIDSDIYVKQNLDHLFNYPDLSAVISGKSYPGNHSWDQLNSGLIIIIPRKSTFTGLIHTLNSFKQNTKFGDQDIINKYFFNWNQQIELHLNEGYNVIARFEPFYYSRNYPIYSIHFTGAKKPWQFSKLDHLKYILELCIRQLLLVKSTKGLGKTIKDLSKYVQICNEIQKQNWCIKCKTKVRQN